MNCSTDHAVVILGATATGKTELAVQLARRLHGEVISVDSRQVYQGLDIGSGKDLKVYGATPYHLLDVVSPLQEYNLFAYLTGVQAALQKIRHNQHLPVLAGGTGLYLDALLRGYRLTHAPANPALRASLMALSQVELTDRLSALRPLHNTTDTDDRERAVRAIEIAAAANSGPCPAVRISLDAYVVGIACPATSQRNRIRQRLNIRIAEGMIEEVDRLQKQGVSWPRLEQFGLEYRYVARYLQGQLNKNDMVQKLAAAIWQFARQQGKWFRRMERNGVRIHWLDGDRLDEALVKATEQQIVAWLNTRNGTKSTCSARSTDSARPTGSPVNKPFGAKDGPASAANKKAL